MPTSCPSEGRRLLAESPCERQLQQLRGLGIEYNGLKGYGDSVWERNDRPLRLRVEFPTFLMGTYIFDSHADSGLVKSPSEY